MPVYSSDVRPPVHSVIHQWVDLLIPYLLSEHSPERTLPLLVADHGNPPTSQPVIYYNTEQLTRKREFDRITARLRAADITEIWDYSTVNIKILQDAGFTNLRHVPVGTLPETVDMIRMWRNICAPEFDVAFCGEQSSRRCAIIEALQREGIRVRTISAWGMARDREIARCRVLLNVHYADDYTVFESVRCDPWLRAGMPVITEKSLDDDPRCAVIAPYNELVEKTVCFIQKLQEASTCPQTYPSCP